METLANLQAKVRLAEPGDVIILKDGVHVAAGPIAIRRAGTSAQPIEIRAETLGGATITGTHGFTVTEPAAHVVISGFKFTHAAGKTSIGPGTSHVRFTRNTFRCAGDGAYLSVSGDDAQIDYNEFADKTTAGSMIAVGGVGSQVARRVWIHRNHFHGLASGGAGLAEMIRFGLTAMSLSQGAGLVEHNLFVGCRGDTEIISNRASGIVYRYNTLLDSPSAQFTLRHGNDCAVYGNILRNTEGLRIFGDRHAIFSNYFEGNYIGINLGNGSGEVADGAALASHDRPDHCIIAFNTLVGNRTHYQLSRRTPDGLGATHTVFANNLLVGGSVAAKIEGPYLDGVWSGSFVWDVRVIGDLPVEAFRMEDPQLVADADGLQRPAPDSPAIGSALGSFPMVTVDLDGQPRPEKMSRGADEPGSENASAGLLTVRDVGPGGR